jgi:peptidoglycan-associated lipoprotein
MRPVRSALLAATTLALGLGLACSNPEPAPAKPKVDTPKATVPDTGGTVAPPTGEGIDKAKLAEQERLAAMRRAAEAALKEINFDFDKSDIRDADKGKLQGIAAFLKNYGQVRLNLEGHCDERGTVEYNIALGDRRAHAALRYLAGLGVAEGRLNPVSYGKERPKVTGHDDQSWFENRRCEFKMAN